MKASIKIINSDVNEWSIEIEVKTKKGSVMLPMSANPIPDRVDKIVRFISMQLFLNKENEDNQLPLPQEVNIVC